MTDSMPVRERVLDYLGAGAIIETRMRETEDGDLEFLQRGLWDIPWNAGGTEKELIDELHEMEQGGLVVASYASHPYAADEFVLHWRLK